MSTHLSRRREAQTAGRRSEALVWLFVSLAPCLSVDSAVGQPGKPVGPVKVIIDADPGIDDAMAIFFALRSPSLDVLGLTTVFGNADIEQATENALRLVELTGRSVPVVRGAEKALVLPPEAPPDFVHGSNGLGNIDLPPATSTVAPMTAAQFIVEHDESGCQPLSRRTTGMIQPIQ